MIEALRSLVADGGLKPCGFDEAAEARALLDQLDAQWLVSVHSLATCGVEAPGGLPVSEWLADTARMSRFQARSAVTVAGKFAATALIGDMVADGRLSIMQGSTLVRRRQKRTAEFFDEHEPELVAIAGTLSCDQLELFMEQWFRRADAAAAHLRDTDVRERRELFLSKVGDSEWALSGTLTAEQGALVSDALEAVSQAGWEGSTETRTMKQRRADALAEIMKHWLENQNSTTVHGARPHISVTIDGADLDRYDVLTMAAALRGESGSRTEEMMNIVDDVLSGVTSHGVVLDHATIERMLCDCRITRILSHGSIILDVGRETESIPHGMRRGTLKRDQHCRYTGCNRPAAWSDVHHIHHQVNGGPHALNNLVLLCGKHHDRVHRLRETLKLLPDGTLQITNGTIVSETRPPPQSGPLFRQRKPSLKSEQAKERDRKRVVEALAAMHGVLNNAP